jgi:hypothetical protein
VGLGFEAGLSVVILAFVLDRSTGAFGSGRPKRLARVRRADAASVPATDEPAATPVDEEGTATAPSGPAEHDPALARTP